MNDFSKLDQLVRLYVLPFAWHFSGALIVWIGGSFLIRGIQRLMANALTRRNVDHTLMNYARATLGLILRVALVLIVLGIFGIETTSFSALLAAAGVAIGVAFSGLLSNLAAGVFLIFFRPFGVGDNVTAGGVTGTVREIGIFATLFDSGDNSLVFLGNNKIFSDVILNYTANQYRQVNLKLQLAHGVDVFQAIQLFATRIQAIPGVSPETPVAGSIVELNSLGTLVNIKFTGLPTDYDTLIAKGNRALYEVIREQKYPIPQTRTTWVNDATAIANALPSSKAT